jgi:hypothetical protein
MLWDVPISECSYIGGPYIRGSLYSVFCLSAARITEHPIQTPYQNGKELFLNCITLHRLFISSINFTITFFFSALKLINKRSDILGFILQ